MDIVFKLYRKEIPYLNNPIGKQIDSYNDFSKIFFDIKKLEEDIFENEFMKLHLILWRKKDDVMLPSWKSAKGVLDYTDEVFDIIEKVGKINYEQFMFQSIKLYSLFNNKENNISSIKNLLSHSLNLFVKEFNRIVNEKTEENPNFDKWKRAKEGFLIFDPQITEHITDKLLVKISSKFEALFEKVDIWTSLNFELNKLFNFKSLDEDFEKILSGEITSEDLNIEDIKLIKSDCYYQEFLNNYKDTDIDNFLEELQINKMDLNKFFQEHKQLLSDIELEIIDKLSKKDIPLKLSNNHIDNIIYHYDKIYNKTIKSNLSVEKKDDILNYISSDLLNTKKNIDIDIVAGNYHIKIDSTLMNTVKFKKEDIFYLNIFEEEYLKNFQNLKVEYIDNFINILNSIKQSKNYEIKIDFTQTEVFYLSILRLFINNYKSLYQNSIFTVSNAFSLLDNFIDIYLVEDMIINMHNIAVDIIINLQAIETRKDSIKNEFDVISDKKDAIYYQNYLKVFIENSIEKYFCKNYQKLFTKVITSITSSDEITLLGIFKDILVSYLINVYKLTEIKNDKYTLLLSFDIMIKEEVLNIFEKLSLKLEKNIALAVPKDKKSHEIYKVLSTNKTPKIDKRYQLIIENHNLPTDDVELLYDKDNYNIKFKNKYATIDEPIVKIEL